MCGGQCVPRLPAATQSTTPLLTPPSPSASATCIASCSMSRFTQGRRYDVPDATVDDQRVLEDCLNRWYMDKGIPEGMSESMWFDDFCRTIRQKVMLMGSDAGADMTALVIGRNLSQVCETPLYAIVRLRAASVPLTGKFFECAECVESKSGHVPTPDEFVDDIAKWCAHML